MPNRKIRYIVLILIILAIILWLNRHDIFRGHQSRPDAQSLDFNRPRDVSQPAQTVLSSDESVNIGVFERVHPAVVNIAATTLGMNFWMEIIPREGQGSGFIIDREGYILTNNHVVAKAQKITVTLANTKKLTASLVGRDPASDLAVIKIPSGNVDTVATLGNSDQVRVGQKAIAIGNPFGLSHTLTTGIVSALHREIRTEDGIHIDDLIQTDAAINPGNSGGPLLNSNGEVIGINTAIFSVSGGYQGIGFAIPINRAREVATQLITSGKVPRPWLGITGISVTKDLSDDFGLAADHGVLIVEVLKGGPADEAGLRGGDKEVIFEGLKLLIGGDIITGINEQTISDMKDLVRNLDQFTPGQTIVLKILSKNIPKERQVVLAERPS